MLATLVTDEMGFQLLATLVINGLDFGALSRENLRRDTGGTGYGLAGLVSLF